MILYLPVCRFYLLYPLEKGVNKFPILIKKCFVQEFVQIRPVALEKDTLQFVNVFSLKRCDPLFEQTSITVTQRCLMPRLVEIGREVLKKIKMFKDHDDDNNDEGKKTNFDQKSLPLPSSKMAKCYQTGTDGHMYICKKYLSLYC